MAIDYSGRTLPEENVILPTIEPEVDEDNGGNMPIETEPAVERLGE